MEHDQPQFSPLDGNSRQIRTLILRPGKGDEQIVCEHEIVSLEKPGDFEALSYCWGPREPSQEITLNDAPLRVSPALAIALSYLRHENDSRRLWIDAICINQEHNDEKLHQVAQMRSIYESASRVLVWLGPPSKKIAAGFRFMEAVSKEYLEINNSGNTAQESVKLSLYALHGIQKLLRRPYWDRLWVIQEIALATQDPMVGCGNRWLPWKVIGNALKRAHAAVSNANSDDNGGNYYRYEALRNEVVHSDDYRELARIRREIQGSRTVRISYRNTPSTNLLELLANTRYKHATNPCDKIYALLGLIRSRAGDDSMLKTPLIPDYDKTCWRVFREATKFAMETEESLAVLQCKNHLNRPELPSWVPDFSNNLTETFPNYRYNSSASGPLQDPKEVRFRISLDLETLYVTGAFIDSVERVVDLQNVDSALGDVILKVHNAVFDLLAKDRDPRHPSSRYLVEALWRTMTRYEGFEGYESEDDFIPEVEELRTLYLALVERHPTKPNFERENEPLDFRPFTNAFLSSVRFSPGCPHRRFIISKKGLLGFGPPNCQKGDSICLFLGYEMPVILRPFGKYHRLLGSAYVRGIMNGEAVPSWELGQKPETFIII